MLGNAVVLQPLYQLFEDTCDDVFKSIQGNLQKVEHVCEDIDVPAALIDALSDDLELRLILRGPVSVLRETYPIQAELDSINIHDLEDWISELANRFMGALKNKLIDYQHYLQLGTPQKKQTLDIDQLNLQGFERLTLNFQNGREVFECSLHTKVLNHELAFDYHESEEDPFADGELEMF